MWRAAAAQLLGDGVRETDTESARRGVLGEPYEWPCGAYVSSEEFNHIMMAMPATLSSEGVTWKFPEGTDKDLTALRESYNHVVSLRDQTIADGILPPLSEWNERNPHLG